MIRQYHRLPSADAVKALSKDFVKLLEEHASARTRARATKAEYESLRFSLDEARRADERERTDAVRQGKKDPGPQHEERVTNEMSRLEESARIKFNVVGQIEREIAGLISTHRGAWTEQLGEVISQDNARLRGLLDQVSDLLGERAAHKGLLAFVAEGQAAYAPAPYAQGGHHESNALGLLIASTVEEADEEEAIAHDGLRKESA